jgi:DNA-damage-inducible protein J
MNNNSSQLQIRIDAETKKKAKKVLEGLGMDISSAIKIFLRQVINTNNFPCEIRDENGLTVRNAEILRESIKEAERSSKSFNQGKELIEDIFKD